MSDNKLPKNAADPIDKLEKFLYDNFDFRYNTMKDLIEVKEKTQTEYKDLGDREVNSIKRRLQDAGIRASVRRIWETFESEFSPEFDPLVNYLDNLAEWDGETDHIEELAKTVEAEEQELWSKYLRKWLVAMVAGWYAGKVNHSVLLLIGKQGVGKTTWLEKLVPKELKDYYYSGIVSPNNKDTQAQLGESALIVMDELENLSRYEAEAFKTLITRGDTKLRKVYRRASETIKRRASFAGSGNKDSFLNDTTGSRRYLCFPVLKINRHHSVNMDRVYSQALKLYKSEFRYWLDDFENQEIQVHNTKFEMQSIEEQLLLKYYTPTGEGDPIYMSSTDLSLVFFRREGVKVDNGFINRLGKAATKHGFKKKKIKGRDNYTLFELVTH